MLYAVQNLEQTLQYRKKSLTSFFKGTIVRFRHRQIQTVINNYYWHLDKGTDAIWPNFRKVKFVILANLKMAALAEKIQLIYRNRFKTFFDLGKLEICYLVGM